MLIKQITINNTYNIKFYKKRILFDIHKYMYTCTISDILDTKYISINFNNIDIFGIMDIYAEFLHSDIDNIVYSLTNCNNTNNYIIEFTYTNLDVFLLHDNYTDYYSKELLNIYSYNDNTMIKLLSIDISNYINSLLDFLFELYSFKL